MGKIFSMSKKRIEGETRRRNREEARDKQRKAEIADFFPDIQTYREIEARRKQALEEKLKRGAQRRTLREQLPDPARDVRFVLTLSKTEQMLHAIEFERVFSKALRRIDHRITIVIAEEGSARSLNGGIYMGGFSDAPGTYEPTQPTLEKPAPEKTKEPDTKEPKTVGTGFGNNPRPSRKSGSGWGGK